MQYLCELTINVNNIILSCANIQFISKMFSALKLWNIITTKNDHKQQFTKQIMFSSRPTAKTNKQTISIHKSYVCMYIAQRRHYLKVI